MEEGKILQLHNFVLTKYEERGLKRIKVSDSAGLWSVSYAETTPVYFYIDSTAEDDMERDVYPFLVVVYGCCTILDADLMRRLYEALSSLGERREESAEDDEATILKEMKKDMEERERREAEKR